MSTIRGRISDPRNEIEAHYHSGVVHGLSGDYELAIADLQRTITAHPDFAAAHVALGQVLSALANIDEAIFHARKAVQLAPDNPDFAATLAEFLEANRNSEEAWHIIRGLLEQGAQSRGVAIVLATMAPRLQRQEEALTLIKSVQRSGAVTSGRELASLHFAAARLVDSLGRYDEAFDEATRANSLRGDRYDPHQIKRSVDQWVQFFDRPTLRRLPRATHGSQLPVFIVGMPRSGTTLVEQILASHPVIHGAGELNWLFAICESAALRHPSWSGGFADCIDSMTVKDADELAEQYLQPLQSLDSRATRVINKMPGNFVHLGLIQLLFPLARVIHCRRDPLDTCLSCYMTDFAAGHEFSASLPSLAHYYRQYRRMMDHWREVLDLPILDVQYEEVVNDLEGQTRRMLEFLDLPWDDGCLHFDENRRFIATASNQQVRNPIYRSSIGRWRHYERQLGPLRAALNDVFAS